ncbi:putative odorant receptor 83c [Wyeomyia smithii]|uniref:putative odorant receptor 83c n=1 Tax=Wyeomyia smithii TaxID=174621 RepID=UPI002468182A|nr:putative odorant receptor 83c [Wyeomyia smithii]
MERVKETKIFCKIRDNMTDPHKVYCDLVMNLNSWGHYALGMNILDLNCSFVNPRYIFLLFIMVSFLYADLESSMLAADLEGFVFNIAMLGFGLQGFAKFDAYVYRKRDMYEVFHITTDILIKHKKTERLNRIMIDCMSFNTMLWTFYKVLYIVVFIVLCTFGTLLTVYSGELQLSFGFQFSFIDTTNKSGYVVTYLYQVTCIFMLVVSSYCNDMLLMVIYINALSMFDCIISDLKELTKLSKLEKTPANKCAMTDQIKSVIKQHKDVSDYLNQSNKVFSLYFFMSLTCLTAAIAVLMIVLVWAHWYAAIFLSVLTSFQILVLCLLGTLLLMKEEELIREVYNVTWYDLTIPDQHLLRLMLLMSQHAKGISYRFGVMNIETYVKSHKLIYSLFTMLVTTQK